MLIVTTGVMRCYRVRVASVEHARENGKNCTHFISTKFGIKFFQTQNVMHNNLISLLETANQDNLSALFLNFE